MIRLPLLDERVLRAWTGDATSQPLPPYGIPLMVQANEADLLPALVTVTFVDEGCAQHRVTTRCLWEHRMPLGWWTMLLRAPDEEASPGALWFARPCETLPDLLHLVTRDLRVVLGRRPHPADGAPPWPACNITTSTTGRERREAIERQEVPKMSTDPDKRLRITQAHVTMATDLAAAIVRAGERRAATLAAGGVLDLADAVFAIDCLAAHIATFEAMLRATEGDYPAESAARAQTMNQRLAEAVSEARAGLERGDDPLLVHTRLKLLIAVAAVQSPENNAPMDAIAAVGGSQPAERSLCGRSVQVRELRLDLTRKERGRLTHADQLTSAPVMLDPDAVQAGVFVTAHGTPIEYDDTPGVRQCERVVTDGPMVAILPSADGAPVVRDLVLNAEGRWSEGDFTTLSEDDGEP